MKLFRCPSRTALAAFTCLTVLASGQVNASLDISNVPLSVSQSVPPMNLLAMGRDHKLFYEAYNDASDLNGDGQLNIRYEPSKIDYYGYFDSFKCYKYESNRFQPVSVTADKRCTSAGAPWSGDWLNYVTTARIDALRKVLYGGKRSTDTATSTILERTFIPQDAHSWGKQYTSEAIDGYKISDYTPFPQPESSLKSHLFANTTLTSAASAPLLRVKTNCQESGVPAVPGKIWNWVSKERPVADDNVDYTTCLSSIDYQVRVEVCAANLLEDNCQQYPDGNYKPIGLLQEYGESAEPKMYFGLVSGTYRKNTSGGVLRKNMDSLADEINKDNGVFTNVAGIIGTIDAFRITGFNYSGYRYDPGWPGAWLTTGPMTEGQFPDWGNPIAEIMYEGLRYLSGKGTPTSAYNISSTDNPDATLGLPLPAWDNPWQDRPYCTRPFMTVISDVNPSYDSDQLPGSHFGTFSGDITGLNVSTIAQSVYTHEYGSATQRFIGQSGTNNDGAPTAKSVSSFHDIRGLAPEEPTKQGSYYSSSISYFGRTNDIAPNVTGTQNLTTYVVALASPLPEITVPVGGQIITIVPFGKSTGGSCLVNAKGFIPTNTIVDFYVETVANTNAGNTDATVNGGLPYYKFRINYEDVEQAADHDMDAIVIYEIAVKPNNSIDITLVSEYASGCITQHMGYIISGTSKDGLYLEVRDKDTPADWYTTNTGGAGRPPFRGLDTPGNLEPGACAANPSLAECNVALPLTKTRKFWPSTESAATLLKNPLYYAAKYGGFSVLEENGNEILWPTRKVIDGEEVSNWDTKVKGVPDNYFLVTNALTLKDQLATAFDDILRTASSVSSAVANSSRLDTESMVFQASFDTTNDWIGELRGFKVDETDGSIDMNSPTWKASEQLPVHSARKIFTYDPTQVGNKGRPFLWNDLNNAQRDLLHLNIDNIVDGQGERRLSYLRNDMTAQPSPVVPFRERKSGLGDIVNSDPFFVANPDFGYSRPNAELTTAEKSAYITFRTSTIYNNRPPMLYVGSNGGMLHGFDASTGVERLAYVPNSVFPRLSKLTSTRYVHEYFVDGSPRVGDAYFGGSWKSVLVSTLGAGGRAMFALDVTNPANFTANNVMWELQANDADEKLKHLGYVLGQATIARVGANNRWVALVGNGYNSAEHKAVLFIIDIATGEVLETINTGLGSAAAPNGLGSPVPVDLTGNRITDVVYAGDLWGNLWKFDLRGSQNQWGIQYKQGSAPRPLFRACDGACTINQAAANSLPITTRPLVGKHVSDGVMVYFGTGKYFTTTDPIVPANPNTERFYAIWDDDKSQNKPVAQSTLLEQKIIGEYHSNEFANSEDDLRVVGNEPINYTGNNPHRGWYIDLVSPVLGKEGERVITSPLIRHGRVVFVTFIPNPDPCASAGWSWLMEVDAHSGARLDDAVFDINRDGVIDDDDWIEVTINGETIKLPPSGKRYDEMVRTPGIIERPDGDIEYKYLSGSSGGITVTLEKGSGQAIGRQSWREID